MSGDANASKAFKRLPATLSPLHYDLRLKPDLAKFTFKGWMSVDLEVKADTTEIICNASELTIASFTTMVGGASTVADPAKDIKLDAEAETLTVTLPTALKAGDKASITCVFAGILNDKMRGFYRSKYPAPNGSGEDRFAAVTQFEATDARRCFPCWDEPAVKSSFTISIIAPNDRTVHSNMPEAKASDPKMDELSNASAEVTEGLKLVNFDPTPVMSTYLVAMVVGEFEGVEGKTKDGILVRSFTPVGKTEQGKFALDASIRSLEFYTEFFDVKYPLPKYDCIAVADFECGAMENWGLVTYRETCILMDPANTSAANKQWIAIVVTHEMAHQWFGNLVTMEWWTHLWLNEGFASFCENYCTDKLFPEFDMWTQFVSNTLIAALELDALESSHPIEVEVGHPDEVQEIFDNISYNKGASVIRMLHNFIGNDAFRKGMNAYLTKHSYKNTLTEDLWKCLGEASGKPVAEVMSTWTGQMGFPVVTVEKVSTTGNTTTVTVSQEKFTADGSKSEKPYLWQIPINLHTSKGLTKNVLMTTKTMDIVLEDTPEDAWVKLNQDYIGYYRVQYPADYLTRFSKDIESKTMSELDRLSILDDIMALVTAGRVSTVVALEMIKSYKHDDSYVVWRTIINCFGKLGIILADEDCNADFKKFVVDTLDHVIEVVGWVPKEGEHHTRGLLRSIIISKIGQHAHDPTVKEARLRFKAHIEKTEELPADLRAPVYRVVMANGDDETFNQMITLFKEATLSEEKDRVARALGAAKDPAVLRKVLSFAVSTEVRNQDTPFVIGSVGANPVGRDLAWDFFQDKFDFFMERYLSGSLMARLIKSTTDSFTTKERSAEVTKFFVDHKNPAERSVKQSIESIDLNAAWLARDKDAIRKFLTAQ